LRSSWVISRIPHHPCIKGGGVENVPGHFDVILIHFGTILTSPPPPAVGVMTTRCASEQIRKCHIYIYRHLHVQDKDKDRSNPKSQAHHVSAEKT